jgi:flagellar biosynthetic protein FliP
MALRRLLAWLAVAALLGGSVAPQAAAQEERARSSRSARDVLTSTEPAPNTTDTPDVQTPLVRGEAEAHAVAPPPSSAAALPSLESLMRSLGTVALFGFVSLLPVAVLTLSAFVRISVVLVLVRQALGSMQVPGNQALSALALLLTLLVMAPVGQRVYTRALLPLWEHRVGPEEAWREASEPIKGFMIEQICRTGHQNYLWGLYAHASEAASRPEPTTCEEFPLQVIAPAFLISELTTALYLGFALFLPFLVVDLVVSAVLSAMGLFLMPPTLVALPIKLALFVLADGWMLVADMLLRSFGSAAT